ncbi:4'-phosphopantetheinyl transferase family protein [Methylomonas methanica]|uniref:4'-phosphopantetheinyl transferase family protein n=1 Tax=Methylomonas methanica TaxID=421 RepID=UPI0007C914A7|nr:4'-phosphopantetheinyl transferase superfamily protein [Methylomonas methanica]
MSEHFVDVWQGRLSLSADTLARLASRLSGDETLKAQAFKFPTLRDRYIAARGLLRETLAGYLAVDPAALTFVSGPYGKPALLDEALHFNISHTADSLLIAVANFADIGIDMEAVKLRRNFESLAERCFSDREYQGWCELPAELQAGAFYRLWTKKEAFVKAVGRGIALGLEQCEFALGSGGQLVAIPDEYGPASAWLVHELDVDGTVAPALDYRRPGVGMSSVAKFDSRFRRNEGSDEFKDRVTNSCAALVTPACGYDLRRLALSAD